MEIAEKHDFNYFLYGGTLISYFRLGDVLPWDDDLDLAIDEKHQEMLIAEWNKDPVTNQSNIDQSIK